MTLSPLRPNGRASPTLAAGGGPQSGQLSERRNDPRALPSRRRSSPWRRARACSLNVGAVAESHLRSGTRALGHEQGPVSGLDEAVLVDRIVRVAGHADADADVESAALVR